MGLIEYPIATTNPVGLINWKNVRLCQQAEARWNQIETSAGVYNWSSLDQIITFQRQNGASVTMGLYGTPTFYAAGTANPTYADNQTVGAWGGTGEGGNPTSLTAVTNFVTACINRYNKAGGAWFNTYGGTLGKGVQYWETWNEPYIQAATNGNVTGNGGQGVGFWWGTGPQLIDLVATQYAAIKAVDASVVVSTPGFNSQSPNPAYFTTVGTSTSKTGLQVCDAVAFHAYKNTPPGISLGTYTAATYDIISGQYGLTNLLIAAAQSGYTALPLWITEYGVDYTAGSTDDLAWYAQSAAYRYTWHARNFMVMAAMGVKMVHPWNWGQTSNTQGNSGNWQQDTNGVQKAYNDFAVRASGKTISNASFVVGGTATLSFNDGTTWTV